MSTDLTITIISWNTCELLRGCLQSVQKSQTSASYEIHVVDNASQDGSAEMVEAEFPAVKLIVNQANLGFAKANNQSWQEAQGRYWLLLNSDAEVRVGALDKLVAFMDAHPKAGLTTARLVNPDGTPQFCAQPVPGIARTLFEAARLHKCLPAALRGRIMLSTYWTYDHTLRLGWTWGTALVARRAAVEECGALSEEFFMYGEDLEWCLRMRQKGWEIWFCPEAEVLHYGGQSSALKWDETGRGQKIEQGFYQALRQHHSEFYVRSLQAAQLIALSAEWLAYKLKGREITGLSAALTNQFRLLKKIAQ